MFQVYFLNFSSNFPNLRYKHLNVEGIQLEQIICSSFDIVNKRNFSHIFYTILISSIFIQLAKISALGVSKQKPYFYQPLLIPYYVFCQFHSCLNINIFTFKCLQHCLINFLLFCNSIRLELKCILQYASFLVKAHVLFLNIFEF